MRKVTQSTMEEYLGLRDMKEAALCIKELKSTARHPGEKRVVCVYVCVARPSLLFRFYIFKFLHKVIDT